MYAIVHTGGKQYRVQPGEVLQVGKPWVDQAKVMAEIVRQGRTRSIMIFKKHRRKNYRRTKGHRQGFTQLRITDITA